MLSPSLCPSVCMVSLKIAIFPVKPCNCQRTSCVCVYNASSVVIFLSFYFSIATVFIARMWQNKYLVKGKGKRCFPHMKGQWHLQALTSARILHFMPSAHKLVYGFESVICNTMMLCNIEKTINYEFCSLHNCFRSGRVLTASCIFFFLFKKNNKKQTNSNIKTVLVAFYFIEYLENHNQINVCFPTEPVPDTHAHRSHPRNEGERLQTEDLPPRWCQSGICSLVISSFFFWFILNDVLTISTSSPFSFWNESNRKCWSNSSFSFILSLPPRYVRVLWQSRCPVRSRWLLPCFSSCTTWRNLGKARSIPRSFSISCARSKFLSD